MNANLNISQDLYVNDYLKGRNKQFYRGHSAMIHPLYETELKNAISCITTFLSMSILKKAYFMRLRKLYNLSGDQCWQNSRNNYTYSEAEACEELVLERDPILKNIENFNKEIEVRIIDEYEKKVKYHQSIQGQNFTAKDYEKLHRAFLISLNTTSRFTFYLLANKLFIQASQ